MRRNLSVIALLILLAYPGAGREGMWVPLLLGQNNLAEMQQMGFRLSGEAVYDAGHPSMKDAVVIFGGGCTGALISGEGLLITNHHCGYRQIQRHSTVENDYLRHGFWATNHSEELPCEGLTVSFLKYMRDVTTEILEGTDTIADKDRRSARIHENSLRIEREARSENRYTAQVRPFFYGNQYYLHVYEVYSDIRLVGAPPSSIGKFGGDTDNWIWPRHTGDFSLFRIYAGKDNQPAPYSKENKPYQPVQYFPISAEGIHPGDFTMVFGYPGRTSQYSTSQAVDLILNQRNPDRIALRDRKLAIFGRYIEKDPAIRIQYAAKHASVSNAWKKWQGEILGLKRLNAMEQKHRFERDFENWARGKNLWEPGYERVFRESRQVHETYAPLIRASDYYSEIVFNGIEVFTLAAYIHAFARQAERSGEISDGARTALSRQVSGFYKDYCQPLDEDLMTALLPLLWEKLPPEFLPDGYRSAMKKYQAGKLLKELNRKSILVRSGDLLEWIGKTDYEGVRKIGKDPLMSLFLSLRTHFDTRIQPRVSSLEASMEEFMSLYLDGILKMKAGTALYPDANSTLRVSYGRVEGYEPTDGIRYLYQTTLGGIMEKDNPAIYDYDVPDRLKELFRAERYEPYGEDGKMPVCFVASNHTSGGNSGSPVIDGEGRLIGVNFDRCWEGTMSDILYDENLCRNIVLDIRYVLFIIDRFAGAGYLLEEMDISWQG